MLHFSFCPMYSSLFPSSSEIFQPTVQYVFLVILNEDKYAGLDIKRVIFNVMMHTNQNKINPYIRNKIL